MDAETYDAWYRTSRGRWIGQVEADLIRKALAPRAGESLLDVGCGTGYFTRALAPCISGRIVGVDTDEDRIAYAGACGPARISYLVADGTALPFAEGEFDLVVSITALCFIPDQMAALREIVRVARRRFAIGLLNRTSLLWLRKGRHGGTGGYRGARWHTVREAKRPLEELPVDNIEVVTAIHCPGAGLGARLVERALPHRLPTGGFILIAGDKRPAPTGAEPLP